MVIADDFEFLNALADEIWLWVKSYDRFREEFEYRDFKREMTMPEWTRVLEIIKKHDLMVAMDNYDFAFAIGVELFRTAVPVFPGVPLEPEALFSMKQAHIPLELRPTDKRAGFKLAWGLFSPITHTAENKLKLRQHGMEERGAAEQGRYEY